MFYTPSFWASSSPLSSPSLPSSFSRSQTHTTPRLALTRKHHLAILPLWTLQTLIALAHLALLTHLFLSSRPAPPSAPRPAFVIPACTSLCSVYILLLSGLVVEGALYVRGRLGAGVYLKAQFAKIALLEVALLLVFAIVGAYSAHIDGGTKQMLGLMGISRIPFLFGPICAWALWDYDCTTPQVASGSAVMTGVATRDFGVFEGDGERAPLLIRVYPPEGEGDV